MQMRMRAMPFFISSRLTGNWALSRVKRYLINDHVTRLAVDHKGQRPGAPRYFDPRGYPGDCGRATPFHVVQVAFRRRQGEVSGGGMDDSETPAFGQFRCLGKQQLIDGQAPFTAVRYEI